MEKKLGNFKRGGKSVIADGHYKFRVTEFNVVTGGSGAPYIIPMCIVINPCPEQGTQIELGFSMSEAAEGIAAAWLTALGLGEEAIVPMDNPDRIQVFLNRYCLHAIIEANVVKGKNPKGYDQNSVNPPWEIMASELGKDDVPGPRGIAAGGREEPSF